MPSLTALIFPNTFVFSGVPTLCCCCLPIASHVRTANHACCSLLQGSSVCLAAGRPHHVTFSRRQVPHALSSLALLAVGLPFSLTDCTPGTHLCNHLVQQHTILFTFWLVYVLVAFPFHTLWHTSLPCAALSTLLPLAATLLIRCICQTIGCIP